MTTPGRLLVGERVRLTAFEPADHPVMARWTEDAGYLRNLRTGTAVPVAPEQVTRLGEQLANDLSHYGFAIRRANEPGIIGFASLNDIEWNNGSAWLGIGIGPAELRGRGLGAEALQLLLQFAFAELNLRRVGLTVIAYNERAISMYRRMGFVEEGVIRRAVEREGAHYDLLVMGLLREEWTGEGSTQAPGGQVD